MKLPALPSLNVLQCQAQFEERRQILLQREAAHKVDSDEFASAAITDLFLGNNLERNNEVIRYCAEWFEHAHPTRQNLNGECDFAALKLCRAYYYFSPRKSLTESTLAAIQRFFTANDFASIYQSENHALIFHTCRYLMAQAYPSTRFLPYASKTGEELAREDLGWLLRFLQFRAQCGWGEFDSTCYLQAVWECLTCLFDFAADSQLKKRVGMMMDLLLADMAVDSLHGLYGGAHGRTYPPYVMDHAPAPTNALQYLYFGTPDLGGMAGIDAMTCLYRPHPLVLSIALKRREAYENRERKHLHNLADVMPDYPLHGSIRKYTYWTPDYVLGCVTFQDAYPDHDHCNCSRPAPYPVTLHAPAPDDQIQTNDYAHHQQHEWDLTFPATSATRIFTHHPGDHTTHNYWTGDRLCNCGHFHQNKNALIALYDIAPSQSHHFIHAYLPKAHFDEVREERGTIFARSGQSFAALTLLPHYRWTSEGEWKDVEVISDGLRHGVICEVGTAAHCGNFDKFIENMLGNTIRFDADTMQLSYDSKSAGHLQIDTKGTRLLDGKPVDLEYGTYDSPYLRSAWKSGVIELAFEDEHLVLDFSD